MTFVFTLVILAAVFVLMAIGLLLSNKTLKKGCSTDPETGECFVCGKTPSKPEQQELSQESLTQDNNTNSLKDSQGSTRPNNEDKPLA